MVPAFLLPEKVVSEDGQGERVALDQCCGQRLQLTLGITRILERESLELHVCGSPDGQVWKVLSSFPRKSFCGTYTLPLDLACHRDIKYLRAEWKMNRWSRHESKPIFSFYVWVESLQPKSLCAAS